MSGLLQSLRQAGYFSALDHQLALRLSRLAGEKNSLAALGLAAASRQVQNGHVCLDLAQCAGQAVVTSEGQGIENARWPELDPWHKALEQSPLVTVDPALEPNTPLVLVSPHKLYLTRYWLYQRLLARELISRASREALVGDHSSLDQDLDRYFSSSPESPDGSQRGAARAALSHPLCVITGGPGTGKTSTVVKILALLLSRTTAAGSDRQLRIKLAAPTGKAAMRLTESIRESLEAEGQAAINCLAPVRSQLQELEAATLHRTLGAGMDRSSGFLHHAHNKLALDVMVVDEASMVDLSLMSKLFAALPDEARVILLGDKDQLASVEAGAILGDMCKDAVAPEASNHALSGRIAVLDHSFRFAQGQAISSLAQAIMEADSDRALAILKDPGEDQAALLLPGDSGHLSPEALDLVGHGFRPYRDARDTDEKLKAFSSFRVLCAHRKGPAGVESLNPTIQNRLGFGHTRQHFAGQPLMVLSNDYQLNLFNGDVGLAAQTQDGLKVFFPGRPKGLLPARLPPAETVFAMTVHKSQGSEFDELILVLPEKRSPILTRELLYTAVTRAKKRVMIYGAEEVIRAAIEHGVSRTSGLPELLS